MKKLNTFAAVAVALGIGLAPQANAIEMETNGVGDSLLFPAFAGQFENYFTISNSANAWIQGHLRFRGAAWSAELLDFDIILSPGDVAVFRVADVDGDGLWEVDISQDIETFQHSGMIFNCSNSDTNAVVQNCIDPSNMLEPDATGISNLTAAGIQNAAGVVGLQRTWGYVEFIGEAILNGMTRNIMDVLESGNAGAWAPYVTTNGNRRGTSTWLWSDAPADNGNGSFTLCNVPNTVHPCDQGLLDVPNVLSGTAFMTVPGQSAGLAYNAEALIDFRTAGLPHRINNYAATNITVGLIAGRNAVILHNENSSLTNAANASPDGDYIYNCCGTDENRDDEVVISFNNTWGPTLADGNDYLPTSIPGNDNGASVIPGLPGAAGALANAIVLGRLDRNDAFDFLRGIGSYSSPDFNTPSTNSISEVEMAIRNASVGQNDVFFVNLPGWIRGQFFTSYYFNGGSPSSSSAYPSVDSMFLAFFPTKFFYRESPVGLAIARSANQTRQAYINSSVQDLLVNKAKQLNVAVWSIREERCSCSGVATISPAPVGGVNCRYVLGHELNVFDIGFLKSKMTDTACAGYTVGRVELVLPSLTSGTAHPLGIVHTADGYPGLIYTLERSRTTGVL